jgi:asparagine synthetase B (glutamine-hydrolysing)
MSKMLGIFNLDLNSSETQFILESINLLSLFKLKAVRLDNGCVAVASLPNTPLNGERLYNEDNDVISFSGDLVGVKSIPWEDILNIFRKKEYEKFKEYQGNFAIGHFNKEQKRVTLISDRRSQQPIYYKIYNNGFVYSTEMSTFCRLADPASFNEKWLYDYFFFNYPLHQTTFLKDTFRMPPASVLCYDFQSSKISLSKYAEAFRKKSVLMEKPRSFEFAANIFKEKIPLYFEGSDQTACALTGGWDGRTMLSLAPDTDKIVTYTYGVPGCIDLKDGTKTAKKANVRHLKIYFNEDFEKELPNHMINAVFLSSGLEKIKRATVLYVYQTLTNYGERFPLTISGIGLDGILKGHSYTPSIVSSHMAELFRRGKADPNQDFWSDVFLNDYSHFRENINDKLSFLQENFGIFTSSEHHLLYKLYITHPELFAGELKIAENFTTVRVPAWDPDILDLAFSIKESALSFSEFTGHIRGSKSEQVLQSYILKQTSPLLASIPILNTRPDIMLKNRYLYEIYRIYRGIGNRLRYLTTPKSPLENWDYWLNVVQKPFIDDLIFSHSSLLKEYITDDFLKKVRENRDMHWIPKLATTEIILRLIRKKWQNIL